MKGYTGSVAFSHCGSKVAVSSPRGGALQIFDSRSGDLLRHIRFADASGLAPLDRGFLVSTGEGGMYSSEAGHEVSMPRLDRNWDNHLVSI